MPIKYQKFITRQDLKNNPNDIYLFGDNLMKVGLGGQAREMRGEPNAIGIPTKFAPGNAPEDFFSDLDFQMIQRKYDVLFANLGELLRGGKTIVIPEAGLGTGLADLPNKAPMIYAELCDLLAELAATASDLEYELTLRRNP